MRLGYDQYKRFFRLFHSLLCYVNEKRQLVDGPFEPWAADADELDTQDVLDALWDDRSLIDDFVRDNPAGFDERDLGQVLQWKNAVDGYFVVVEHTPQFSVFLGDGYAFGVVGLGEELSQTLPHIPEPVRTALLPFDGCIVYSAVLSLMNGRFGGGFDEFTMTEYAAVLREHPLVLNPEQLAEASFACRERAGQREIERMLEELEDASDPEHPGGPSAPHIHRGKLAGLSESDREALISESVKEAASHGSLYADVVEDLSYKRAPITSLEDLVSLRTKDVLVGWARDLGLKGVSSMKKAEVAAAVAQELVAQSDIMLQLICRCSEKEYESVRAVLDAGGSVSRDQEALFDPQASREVRLLPFPPLLNAFQHGGTVTFSIPDELRAVLAECDWNELEGERLLIQQAMHCANVYAELLGVADVFDLWDLYAGHYPEGMDRPTFLAFLLATRDDLASEFGLWESEDDLYVVYHPLLDEFEDSEFFDEADEGDISANEALRRYLVSRHEEIPIKAVEGDFDRFDPYEAKMQLPAVKALRAFLDEHVPDGQNDLYFADRVLEEIEIMVQYECMGDDYLDFLEGQGLAFGSTSKMNQLLTLLSNAANDMPHWATNGWSPTELLEQATGHKVFRNPDGSIRKVGRNEPCPCGSGKKYKKCCGC